MANDNTGTTSRRAQYNRAEDIPSDKYVTPSEAQAIFDEMQRLFAEETDDSVSVSSALKAKFGMGDEMALDISRGGGVGSVDEVRQIIENYLREDGVLVASREDRAAFTLSAWKRETCPACGQNKMACLSRTACFKAAGVNIVAQKATFTVVVHVGEQEEPELEYNEYGILSDKDTGKSNKYQKNLTSLFGGLDGIIEDMARTYGGKKTDQFNISWEQHYSFEFPSVDDGDDFGEELKAFGEQNGIKIDVKLFQIGEEYDVTWNR